MKCYDLKHSCEFLSKGPCTMSFQGGGQLNYDLFAFLPQTLKYWSDCEHCKTLSILSKFTD